MRNLDNENERNNIIVESIVELSKKLNISVVVEGVESEKQVNFLKSIGAEVIQGYYFSKPIPTDEYEKREVELSGEAYFVVSPNKRITKVQNKHSILLCTFVLLNDILDK